MTLPTVGDDYNAHGTKLNAHINVAHNADGTIKTTAQTIIQVVNTQTGALNNITTQIPDDDTIPQITEGEEIMTRTITPKSATSKLKIDVVVNGSNEAGLGFIVALFETTTHATNAIAGAVPQNFPTGNRPTCVSFTYYMTAPGTSEYTFRVRMGSDSGDSNFNGINIGRLLGGVLASSITITEIKA